MNERIKTLAKVAGYDEINKAAMKLTGFDPEKFAELIIRECALVVHKKTGPKSAWDVLQHFGVEE